MDVYSPNVLSLCSGIAGLDIGLRLAVPNARTVCYVEREAYCCEVLVSRIQDQTICDAPIWSDITTFDCRPCRGVVDWVVGSYPCQPFSLNGARGGRADPRNLWPHFARIISELQPELCFFENVGGHLSLGFEEVVQDLERMDYRVACDLFAANEIGGPFRGERLFIFATNASTRTCRLCEGEELSQMGSWRWSHHKDMQSITDAPFERGDRYPQPILRRLVDGIPNRVERLHALGNAVVPSMAANAFRKLEGILFNEL